MIRGVERVVKHSEREISGNYVVDVRKSFSRESTRDGLNATQELGGFLAAKSDGDSVVPKRSGPELE
jgi:hypothetical protein